MSIRLAVVTDIHYSGGPNRRNPGRKGAYGALLLKRFLKLLEIEGWPEAADCGAVPGHCRVDEVAGRNRPPE